jgi:hypothetical protein
MVEAGDPVAEFRAVAGRYVSAVETAGERSAEELIAMLARLLPDVYQSALRLPYPTTQNAALAEAQMTHEQWKEVFDRLQTALGAHDLYWTVPAWENDREAMMGSLADDLADIYRDLKDGLELATSGASEDEVVWEWRLSFGGTGASTRSRLSVSSMRVPRRPAV